MIAIPKSDLVRVVECDPAPDTSYLDQNGFEGRRAAYHRGEFAFVCVRARAEIPVPFGSDSISCELQSPGLWGIESDSDHTYLESVFEEECSILQEMLSHLNVMIVS